MRELNFVFLQFNYGLSVKNYLSAAKVVLQVSLRSFYCLYNVTSLWRSQSVLNSTQTCDIGHKISRRFGGFNTPFFQDLSSTSIERVLQLLSHLYVFVHLLLQLFQHHKYSNEVWCFCICSFNHVQFIMLSSQSSSVPANSAINLLKGWRMIWSYLQCGGLLYQFPVGSSIL